MNEKAREARMRRLAAKMDLMIRKSRVQNTNLDDLGGYQIIDIRMNIPVAGSRYDLDLDGVEAWLTEEDPATN